MAEIAEPGLVETGRERFAVRRRPGLVEECSGVMGDLIKPLQVIGVALGPCFLPARIGDDPLEQGAAGYLADVAKRHDVLEAFGDLMDFVAI